MPPHPQREASDFVPEPTEGRKDGRETSLLLALPSYYLSMLTSLISSVSSVAGASEWSSTISSTLAYGIR